jgi:hypothetical protein
MSICCALTAIPMMVLRYTADAFFTIARIIVLKFAINISKNFIDIGFFVHYRYQIPPISAENSMM